MNKGWLGFDILDSPNSESFKTIVNNIYINI